jgi:sodium-dependent dicarboxylate transporter 2/3/5
MAASPVKPDRREEGSLDMDPAGERKPEIKDVFSPSEEAFDRRRKAVGFVLAPLLFFGLLLLPIPALKPEAHRLAAILAAAVCLWITESLPIPVTSLLAPCLAVILGVGKVKEVFAPFGDPIIMLFMGSFIIAGAMSIHGLDRRIALGLLSCRFISRSAYTILLGFGLITALLSSFLSNTATTAMMLPIILGVLATMAAIMKDGAASNRSYAPGVLLFTGYAASIGGLMTPVGTPPNLIAMGFIEKLAGVKITFFQWMTVGIPVSLVMLAWTYAYLSLVCRPGGAGLGEGRRHILEESRSLGRWTRGEINTLTSFLTAVVLWVLPGIVALAAPPGHPVSAWLSACLPEGVVALVAASLLFILPVSWKERRFTLSFAEAKKKVDWGTLLLFAGGLSLGGLMFKTGLAEALGHGLLGIFPIHSVWSLTFLCIVLSMLLTETTSNTAAANMVVPLAVALAASLKVSPLPPAIGAGIAASLAFMLPVSTPPNAIVYGSGLIPITRMIRVGVVLSLSGTLITWLVLRIVLPLVGFA